MTKNMDRTANLLIVDDDESIRDAVAEYLSGHGFNVRAAADAAIMDRMLRDSPADLLVLDLMLPGEDGLAICRRLAPTGIPILILSALGATTDRVVGLELGAADYLPKPFEARELLARIRAVLRRDETTVRPKSKAEVTFAGWLFDPGERRLRDPAGRTVTLTQGEHNLLAALVARSGRLLSRDQLIDLARGHDADPYDRAVDLAISRLRRKLADRDPTPLIETVRGAGYRFAIAVKPA